MRKTTKSRRIRPAHKKTSSWLPVDTRFFPDIISFGHVQGFSRIFLTIEMVLVTLVVFGALILACCQVFP